MKFVPGKDPQDLLPPDGAAAGFDKVSVALMLEVARLLEVTEQRMASLREAMHSVVTTGQSDRFRGHLLQSGAEVECSLSIFRASMDLSMPGTFFA